MHVDWNRCGFWMPASMIITSLTRYGLEHVLLKPQNPRTSLWFLCFFLRLHVLLWRLSRQLWCCINKAALELFVDGRVNLPHSHVGRNLPAGCRGSILGQRLTERLSSQRHVHQSGYAACGGLLATSPLGGTLQVSEVGFPQDLVRLFSPIGAWVLHGDTSGLAWPYHTAGGRTLNCTFPCLSQRRQSQPKGAVVTMRTTVTRAKMVSLEQEVELEVADIGEIPLSTEWQRPCISIHQNV
jgi:hypothetical protein